MWKVVNFKPKKAKIFVEMLGITISEIASSYLKKSVNVFIVIKVSSDCLTLSISISDTPKEITLWSWWAGCLSLIVSLLSWVTVSLLYIFSYPRYWAMESQCVYSCTGCMTPFPIHLSVIIYVKFYEKPIMITYEILFQIRAAIRTLNPREQKYMDQEQKFKISVSHNALHMMWFSWLWLFSFETCPCCAFKMVFLQDI